MNVRVDQQLGPDHPAHVVGDPRARRPAPAPRASARARSRTSPSSSPTMYPPSESRTSRPGPTLEPPHSTRHASRLPGADDRLHAVLDQPVADRDEGADPAARDQRLQRDVVQRRLDRDQREVELALELRRRERDGVEHRGPLGALLARRRGRDRAARATCSSLASSTTTSASIWAAVMPPMARHRRPGSWTCRSA